MLEDIKNIRRQHAAPKNGEVGNNLLRHRLFNHVEHIVNIAAHRVNAKRTVAGQQLPRYLLDTDNALPKLLMHADQLADRGLVGNNNVVSVQHCERLVADKGLRAPDRMPQAARLLLADILDVAQTRQGDHLVVQILLAGGKKLFLQFRRMIEMILNQRFAAVGNNQDILDPACDSLLHDILDSGLVHNRKHLFGNGLGCG